MNGKFVTSKTKSQIQSKTSKRNTMAPRIEVYDMKKANKVNTRKRTRSRKRSNGTKKNTVKNGAKGTQSSKRQSMSLEELKAITEQRVTMEMAYAAKAFFPKSFDAPVIDLTAEKKEEEGSMSSTSSVCTDSDGDSSIDLSFMDDDDSEDSYSSRSSTSTNTTQYHEEYDLPLWTNPSSGQSIFFLSTAKNMPSGLAFKDY